MKLALLLIMLFVVSGAYASVYREVPQEAVQGETVTIPLHVRDATPGSSVVIGELIPEGATLGNWRIVGAEEGPEGSSFVQDGRSLVWEFTTVIDEPFITYEITMPDDTLIARFDAVYAIEPDDYGNARDSLVLTPVMPSAAVPFVPASAVPEVESPAPIPMSSTPWPLGLLVLFMVVAGMTLYLRTRLTQYTPYHSSFVDGLRKLSMIAVHYAGLRLGLVVPVGLTPKQEAVLDTFSDEQRRMLARIDALSKGVHHQQRLTLDELKRELLSIQFSYETA